MKHAFIFGTNIYLSDKLTVSYGRKGKLTEFLLIRTFFEPDERQPASSLSVDAVFSLTDDELIRIKNNKIEEGGSIRIVCEPDRVKIYRVGHEVPVLDIFQLAEHALHGFGTLITNEIEIQRPDFVLTIKGNIKVDGSYIWIDNEKLHVDTEDFASGVTNAHHGVILTADEWTE